MQNYLAIKKTKFAALVSAMCFSSVVGAADLYEVIDLGPIESSFSEAFSINDSNTVVGTANGDDFLNRAYMYQNGQAEFLSYIPYSFDIGEITYEGHSLAFDINNLDVIVGSSGEVVSITEIVDGEEETTDYTIDSAVVFDQLNQSYIRIPKVETIIPRDSKALAVNDNNLAVGYVNVDNTDEDTSSIFLTRGFFYNIDNETLTIIDPINTEQPNNLVLRDINESGTAVGITSDIVDERGVTQVLVVDVSNPDVVEIKEIFGGAQQHSWAINDSNKIVGKALDEDNRAFHGFVYDSSTQTATSLGFLNENSQFSEAFDINNSDQIVGMSQFQNSPSVVYHAFLYENGVMRDLNKLIGCNSEWILNEARSINDFDSGFNSGVITGAGLLNGEKRAFMLMPVAGSTPDCSAVDDDSGGSGSIPWFGLSFLLSLIFITRSKLISSNIECG